MSTLRTYEDAVVVMTGGASGIGRTMATELVRRGATVVLADRDLPLAKEAAAAMGARASAVACDVTEAEVVATVIDDVVRQHGRLDYLFNNAGIVIGGDTAAQDVPSFRRVIDVNLNGVMHGVQAAWPHLVAQGFGHVVNTASMAGLLPTPGMVSYGTTKHAVVGMSKSLRIEGAPHGLRVSVLCPGFIRTPILTGGKYGGLPEGVDPDRQLGRLEQTRPMDPDLFAARALDAVARNEAMIVLPRWWRWVWLAHRVAPVASLALFDQLYRRERRSFGLS